MEKFTVDSTKQLIDIEMQDSKFSIKDESGRSSILYSNI